MSTVMDTVAGKGRNVGTNVWSALLIASLVVFAGNTLYATYEGGAPGRRQHGGLEPAGELAEARQPGPRGGRRQGRVVRRVQGHQGADRRRHQAAQRALRPDRRRRRPDRDRHRDLGAAGQERRPGDRVREGRARPGRQRRPLRPARPATAGAARRSGARHARQRCAVLAGLPRGARRHPGRDHGPQRRRDPGRRRRRRDGRRQARARRRRVRAGAQRPPPGRRRRSAEADIGVGRRLAGAGQRPVDRT